MNPHCNQNCVQGRFCDCEDSVSEPMTGLEWVGTWAAFILASIAAVYLVGVIADAMPPLDAAYVRNVLNLIVDALDAGFNHLISTMKA